MTIPRIYQPVAIAVNQELVLDKEASHHLARVLRMSLADEIIIFNGDGLQYTATLRAISKHTVTVLVNHEVPAAVESALDLHLVQGIAKGEKMDWIIQKAVELGVTGIHPVYTERGNVHLSAEREAKRLAHWQKVVISACEQSGRVTLPILHPAQHVRQYLRQLTEQDWVFVLSPHDSGGLPETVKSQRVSVIIGPEGGLSEEEMKLALSHHCKPLQLGPRILRTETAALTALGILQYQYGDLR